MGKVSEMSVIDAVERFTEIQREVMFDRQLCEEYGLKLSELEAYIIIDDRMFAFLPEKD